LAAPGTLRLLPSGNLIEELAEDYKKMEEMIYNNPPSFESIIETLGQLEADINALTFETV
jgi:PHD/YefM family antitoxin component YafN of YafNO toxin-antitoxin module